MHSQLNRSTTTTMKEKSFSKNSFAQVDGCFPSVKENDFHFIK
jgi:hypothetical protein